MISFYWTWLAPVLFSFGAFAFWAYVHGLRIGFERGYDTPRPPNNGGPDDPRASRTVTARRYRVR